MLAEVLDRARKSLSFRFNKFLRGPVPKAPLRWWASRRGWPVDGSSTVIIATWNMLPYLKVALDAVRRYNPDVPIIVVDNKSTDGTRTYLRSRRDVRSLFLPANIGHGAALDYAALLVRTEFLISLDVDAFPIADGWIDRLTGPLKEGFNVAGVQLNRPYAHPCTMAIRTRRFIEVDHTFTARWRPEGLGESAWDAGELISMREAPSVFLFERTSSIGPGCLGTTWAGLTFHLFYARFLIPGVADDLLDPEDGVTRPMALAAWDQALREYFPQRAP